MSLLAVQGGATGTGTVTLLAPVTNTNQTLTLPDATGTVQVSGTGISGTTGTFSGDLSFNSGYGSAAVGYGCRAWVNFNGTGTPAIRASGNVSSITDNGTGNYTVNFTTAMPDVNYAANATCDEYFDSVTAKTTGGCTVTNTYQTSFGGALAFVDNDNVSVIVFR
jgi:uncharacterized protein (AIM24 family)